MNSEQVKKSIYSVGHSTRTLKEFLTLLREHDVTTLADIRRFPRSRRHPHFSIENLGQTLQRAGISYVHLEALGGHRRPARDSPNANWRNASFRGYADHMGTAEFRSAVNELLMIPGRVAVMCAEAVPWRCHRNLLSDELTRRGIAVLHILGPGSSSEHMMNPAARDAGGFLVYGSEDAQSRLPI